MKKATWQYFTLEEYRQRLDALRKRMEEKGVDVMLIHTPENLCYMTGYQTPGYYWYQTLVVPMDGEPVFITRLLEDSNAEHLSWVEDRRPYGDSEDWVSKTRDVLADLGMRSKRIGIEKRSWFITNHDYEKLKGMMPRAKFMDCSMLVEEGRMIKSPREIEYMRHAAQCAEAGVKAGIEASRVGASENEIAAAIHEAQIKAGSEYTGLPIFITAGARSFLAHVTWYRGTVKSGDTVFLEIPGCINRYHSALIRNVYMGDPPPKMVKAAGVMTTALEEMIKFIRPGVTAHDAHMLCQKVIEDGGLGATLNHRAGYSIGLAFAPDWGEGHIISMTIGEKRQLRAGMTFHIIPSVFLPGLTSVGMSETILVTEKGCRPITANVERKLFSK